MLIDVVPMDAPSREIGHASEYQYQVRSEIEANSHLCRFVSGSADSKWGSLRAEQGHPEPWELNFFAIGNEVLTWPLCSRNSNGHDPRARGKGLAKARHGSVHALGTRSLPHLPECSGHVPCAARLLQAALFLHTW